MPVIAKFYGIVIRMIFLRSFQARFHALHRGGELIVSIAPLRVLEGDAPPGVRSIVLAWAAQHQMELLAAWNRLSWSQAPARIEPWK
jgi:hypothetical protein